MSNYRDRPLIDYLPMVLKNVREFQLIIETEQPEIFKLFEAIQLVLDNQFVLSSTEYGVKRWEKMLKINPKATMTLDERKFVILTYLMHRLPYTFRKLEEILNDLCGEGNFTIELDPNEYTLKIRLALFSNNNAEAIGKMLKQICPANLTFTTAADIVQIQYVYCVGIMFQSITHELTGSADLHRTIDIEGGITVHNAGAFTHSTVYNSKDAVDLSTSDSVDKSVTLYGETGQAITKQITQTVNISI